MENIYKPKTLPQLSAPFSYVVHNLHNMGIPYEMVGANVDSINPSQGFIDSDIVAPMVDKLKNGEELKAIWLDKDNNNLDGHHRYAAYALNKNSHIPSVRLGCEKERAIEILNEIQKKYEDENNSPFLNALTEENEEPVYTPEKDLPGKKETVTAYREKPIVEKAPSGNFFSLKEIEGWKPYEIDFSSLVDSDEIDESIKEDKNPVMALATHWFPSVNLPKKAKELEMNLEDFITTVVAEKARTKKIDGIRYGDKLLQSIDDK